MTPFTSLILSGSAGAHPAPMWHRGRGSPVALGLLLSGCSQVPALILKSVLWSFQPIRLCFFPPVFPSYSVCAKAVKAGQSPISSPFCHVLTPLSCLPTLGHCWGLHLVVIHVSLGVPSCLREGQPAARGLLAEGPCFRSRLSPLLAPASWASRRSAVRWA